jgi:hypothetical protein
MMAIKIVAERVPPGDRWVLTDEVIQPHDEQVVLTSLTDCLNEIFKTTGDRVFTVDAGKGNVSVEEERTRGPRVWDLYGEKSDDKEILSG